MKQNLKRRLAKVEAQLGANETQLRRLAARLHIDPERILGALEGRGKELARHVAADGLITWEGFLTLSECLGWNTIRGSVTQKVGSPSESCE